MLSKTAPRSFPQQGCETESPGPRITRQRSSLLVALENVKEDIKFGDSGIFSVKTESGLFVARDVK